jgi:predicted nucleic acid-binding protein
MNLDDIQSGSLCVADTNVLLYAEQGTSHQSQRLLRRCATGDLLITLPQTVWHELTHKLMLAEAMMNGSISGPNPARNLAKRPDVVKRLGLYREKISALVKLGLGFETCTSADFFETAFANQERYGLLINDSLILATALRLKADVLVTADMAFRDVVELQVAMPSDLKP